MSMTSLFLHNLDYAFRITFEKEKALTVDLPFLLNLLTLGSCNSYTQNYKREREGEWSLYNKLLELCNRRGFEFHETFVGNSLCECMIGSLTESRRGKADGFLLTLSGCFLNFKLRKKLQKLVIFISNY